MGISYYALGKNTLECLELQYSGEWYGEKSPPIDFFLRDDFEGPFPHFNLPNLSFWVHLPQQMVRSIGYKLKRKNPSGILIGVDYPTYFADEDDPELAKIRDEIDEKILRINWEPELLLKYLPELRNKSVVEKIIRSEIYNPTGKAHFIIDN